MDNVSNNLLVLLLIFAMLLSVLGSTSTLFKIADLQSPSTGHLGGFVGICISSTPILSAIGDQVITQGDSFYLDVNDTAGFHMNETVLFYDNATFFDINSSTGEINFTSTSGMVGEHWVQVSINESYCGTEDSEIINFTVINVNDAPILDFIPNQTLYEDIIFIYDVNATDPDQFNPEGEEIWFGSNSTFFEINETTGLIWFMPVLSEVGNYSVLIFVYDDEYIDTQVVHFEILAVNDTPILSFIGARTAIEDQQFNLQVNATDEENDTLFFYDNVTIFNINISTGLISFMPNASQIGNYSINISVSDGNSLDFEVISFTVVHINHPPNITNWYPNEVDYNDAKELTNKTTSVWYYSGPVIEFSINVTDPDGTSPTIYWILDNQSLEGEHNLSYNFDTFPRNGIYELKAVASDGLINDTHTWAITTLEQIGVIPSPPGGGGGGPGTICFENWRCSQWSVCSKTGMSLRSCIDLSDCDTFVRKPDENKSCIYTPYPSCFDGIKNCHDNQCEIMPDCGGPCGPCPTCDDKTRNQGEKSVDCGGPCPPCPEDCIQTITFGIDPSTGQCKAFQSPCDIPEGWKVVDECPPIQPMVIFLYIIILAFLASATTLIWMQRKTLLLFFTQAKRRSKDAVIKSRERPLTREEIIGRDALSKINTLGTNLETKKKDDDEDG